jgi:hypothetical protein
VTDTTGAEGGSKEIAASWFVKSEAGEPLGQISRGEEAAVPSPGSVLTAEAKWRSAEVVSFRELGPTCSIRRYAVVVRVLE